jgi:hypothetical protein
MVVNNKTLPPKLLGLPMLRIVIPKGLLTQSLSKANFVCFLLFSFSPAYTSELVTLP